MLFLYLPLLITVTSIGLVTLGIVEFKCYFEEEKLRKHLASEAAKRHEREAKEKLIRAKSILQRVAQEFRVISSTLEWTSQLLPVEFHNRYQDLWDRSNEAQMLIAFYAPTLKESADSLDEAISIYWRKLYAVLVVDQVERTTLNYLEVVEYSQMIPTQIQDIRQKVKELTY